MRHREAAWLRRRGLRLCQRSPQAGGLPRVSASHHVRVICARPVRRQRRRGWRVYPRRRSDLAREPTQCVSQSAGAREQPAGKHPQDSPSPRCHPRFLVVHSQATAGPRTAPGRRRRLGAPLVAWSVISPSCPSLPGSSTRCGIRPSSHKAGVARESRACAQGRRAEGRSRWVAGCCTQLTSSSSARSCGPAPSQRSDKCT